MLVKLDTVACVHPHEVRTMVSDTLFERRPVRLFGLNTVRSVEIHSGVFILKIPEHATRAIYYQPGSVLPGLWAIDSRSNSSSSR